MAHTDAEMAGVRSPHPLETHAPFPAVCAPKPCVGRQESLFPACSAGFWDLARTHRHAPPFPDHHRPRTLSPSPPHAGAEEKSNLVNSTNSNLVNSANSNSNLVNSTLRETESQLRWIELDLVPPRAWVFASLEPLLDLAR